MIGEDRLMEIGQQVLKNCPAHQAEIAFHTSTVALTRYANNVIHQNNVIANIGVALRVALGKKVGVSSCNSLQDSALKQLTQSALAIAKAAPEKPDFVSLPTPEPVAQVDCFDEVTGRLTPDDRAEVVSRVIALAKGSGLTVAGAFENSSHELAVLNSLGVRSYHRDTGVELSAMMMSKTGSGLAREEAWQAERIDAIDVAARARGKALQSENPTALPPGGYTVVLEPLAVADLVHFLAYLGFGARQFQEGRSFMAGNIGKQVVGENITIWDDGLDLEGYPLPFDWEGVPKQKVMLIEKGVARGVVYDTVTSAKEGKRSTGHAPPAGTTFGPHPGNLFVASGDSSLPEMIAETDRGLLVTRFHYTNVSEPMKTVITGMTRDGTFLIEGGRITKPIKNLRFTQSILKALSCVCAISRERKLVQGTLVPAMKIESFRFSSRTEF